MTRQEELAEARGKIAAICEFYGIDLVVRQEVVMRDIKAEVKPNDVPQDVGAGGEAGGEEKAPEHSPDQGNA